MDIALDNSDLQLDSPVMLKKRECCFAIEFRTMRDEIHWEPGHVCFDVPNDRDALPKQPTLRDVILLALKRLHPVFQYVAEQKGIRIVGYHERYTFSQAMSCIEYGPDGQATRLVL